MKITDINVKTFRYESQIVSDDAGHTHPGDSHETTQTLLTIDTDEGVPGHAFGANKEISENLFRHILIGEDPFYREKHWQSMKHWQRLHRGLTDQDVRRLRLHL